VKFATCPHGMLLLWLGPVWKDDPVVFSQSNCKINFA